MASRLAYPEGKPKFCQWEGCEVSALYQIGYEGRWMSACGKHDYVAGAKNLIAAGWSPREAASWMRKPY